MNRFLRRYWQDILWLFGYLAGCALLTLAIGPYGLIVGLALGVFFYIYGGLSPKEVRVIAMVVLVPMIFLGSLKVYDYAKEHKWQFTEASEAALSPRTKTETEKLADTMRRIENKVDTALENAAATSDALEEFKAEIEKRFPYNRDRLDATLQPKVAEPTFKWAPAIPKMPAPATPPEPAEEEGEEPTGGLLPNTEPKEPLPELRAKIPVPQKKPVFPKKLVCDCGHVHSIEGWDDLKNGSYMPQYEHCTNPATGFACDVLRYEKVVQK